MKEDEMRDRLMAVIEPITRHSNGLVSADELSDALMSAGVVLPRFKVGQEVYYASLCTHEIYESIVSKICIEYGKEEYVISGNTLTPTLTKNVFSTEAEALGYLGDKESW